MVRNFAAFITLYLSWYIRRKRRAFESYFSPKKISFPFFFEQKAYMYFAGLKKKLGDQKMRCFLEEEEEEWEDLDEEEEEEEW